MSDNSITNYAEEVADAWDYLINRYPNKEVVALNVLNFAVSARNADHMNQNIVATMNVTDKEV